MCDSLPFCFYALNKFTGKPNDFHKINQHRFSCKNQFDHVTKKIRNDKGEESVARKRIRNKQAALRMVKMRIKQAKAKGKGKKFPRDKLFVRVKLEVVENQITRNVRCTVGAKNYRTARYKKKTLRRLQNMASPLLFYILHSFFLNFDNYARHLYSKLYVA